MTGPIARYFKPDESGAVPWHQPLEAERIYTWAVAPRSGIARIEHVDVATVTLLSAVEEALDSYVAAAVPANARAGVFVEMLATALQSLGGDELTFGFRSVVDDRELTVPAQPF